MKGILLAALTAALMSTTALAQDIPAPKGGARNYSPYPEKTFPNSVYFGDTHLHTTYSTDAGNRIARGIARLPELPGARDR